MQEGILQKTPQGRRCLGARVSRTLERTLGRVPLPRDRVRHRGAAGKACQLTPLGTDPVGRGGAQQTSARVWCVWGGQSWEAGEHGLTVHHSRSAGGSQGKQASARVEASWPGWPLLHPLVHHSHDLRVSRCDRQGPSRACRGPRQLAAGKAKSRDVCCPDSQRHPGSW